MKKLILAILVLFCLGLAVFTFTLPQVPDDLNAIALQNPTRMFSRNGQLVKVLANREVVKLEDMSPYVIHAILALEDKDFYKHKGFSKKAFLRAWLTNIRRMKIVEGGSTITQQLVKLTFLDLSENQVIVFTDWMGRSPKEIEDQITYPLSVNLQGLAGVKAVRSSSEFNFSMINIIFEDNIDFYFARQRVLERLTLASTFLPPGVVPYLAPDATALGQIFWYTVEGEGQDLGRLRAIQDWYVRYQLNSVPGVAQVASAGGFPIEYQIDVDPNNLRAYNVTLGELFSAIAQSNSAVGGKVVQKGNAEYIVRGVGWIESTKDIEKTVVKVDPEKGTPIYVSNLGSVSLGAEFRRSVLEKNGNEAVGAVVMMRHGENPLEVTKRIKAKIQELQPGLPEGVRIVPFYDRTRLIHGAIETVTETLRDEMIIASLAILLILMHFRSAVVICMTLPLAPAAPPA